MGRVIQTAFRVFAITATLSAVGIAFAPTSRTGSPYFSALSDLAVTQALAAKKHCANSACEFVAPAFTCLGESPGSKCVRTTSGCTTQHC
ncbi:MAG TPA: hypothetical protein VKL61_02030 [Candidatus Polarisedimenticolia bacterium]|nr:hypothetical protein [Candidatus Polarisedimenticolia bacterium]